MDDLDISEDTTDREQEDLPYDGDLFEKTELLDIHWDESFPLKEKMSLQPLTYTYTELSQSDISNGATKRADGTLLETHISKKSNEEEPCTGFFPIPVNEESSNSKISDVMLKYMSKNEFSNTVQPVACETCPRPPTESFDETIVKSFILHCSETSLSREPKTKLSDHVLYKTNTICKQSCHRQLTRKESIFNYEESMTTGDCLQKIPYFEVENESPMYPQTKCGGQMPQKLPLEIINSDDGLKNDQYQIHNRLLDLSQFASKIRMSNPNSISHRLATVVKQTISSPNLSRKSAIVQDGLGSMVINILDRKPQEDKEKTIEFMQDLKLMTECVEAQHLIDQLKFNNEVSNPLVDVPRRSVTELATETNVLKLPPTTEEQLPSSPSQLLTKTTKGDSMCQEISEKTKQLKTKVEELSKRVNYSYMPSKENRQVLEILQGSFEELERNYLSIKETHRILQNHNKNSTLFEEFDPERKVEGEIFKIEMLLENIRDRIDESTSGSIPLSSLDALDILNFALCPLPNEVPKQENGHGPSGKSDHEIKLLDPGKQDQGNTLIPFPKDESVNKKEVILAKIQEPPQDCLCELYPQVYLGLPRRDATLDEDAPKLVSKEESAKLSPLETNQLAVKLSSDLMKAFSSLEEDDIPESLQSIKQSVMRQDWHSDHELPERNQKKEKKDDSRKPRCERFSVIIQEKEMNLNLSDSTYCTDAGDSLFSDSRYISNTGECRSCMNKRLKSQEKEFQYKYNCTGQNPLNFNECDGFIRFCALSKNQSLTPAVTYPKQDENAVQPSQNEHLKGSEHPKMEPSKRSEKSKSVCSQTEKHHVPRTTSKSSQGQDEMTLAGKRNMKFSKSNPGIYDQIANSPHCHSRKISGSKVLYSIQNINKDDSEILNSALDHALKTAISLKETTEQMIKAIAEDLAKAQGRRSHQKF
ncbi:protein AKNAD1 isoform X1 [Monodelphis domestica]|uniref:protein AKNAD1 isoform X1 n=1 Tax=Monodelphis domestica TaxID=13616 RepID=UPI0024E219F8|nr:protein AKNAD1 isoform X1 [Monodelphis domestica]